MKLLSFPEGTKLQQEPSFLSLQKLSVLLNKSQSIV